MITPTEISAQAPVTLIGWGSGRSAVQGAEPLDKQIKIAGVPFTVVASARRRARRSASR
jgi:hypothetical protein